MHQREDSLSLLIHLANILSAFTQILHDGLCGQEESWYVKLNTLVVRTEFSLNFEIFIVLTLDFQETSREF